MLLLPFKSFANLRVNGEREQSLLIHTVRSTQFDYLIC